MVCCSNAVGIMPVRNAKSVMSSVRLCRRTSIHSNERNEQGASLLLGLPCSILPCSLGLTTTIAESLPLLTLEPAVLYLKLHGQACEVDTDPRTSQQQQHTYL
jgi:hypothetical protein